jgi:hypothetical protein
MQPRPCWRGRGAIALGSTKIADTLMNNVPPIQLCAVNVVQAILSPLIIE